MPLVLKRLATVVTKAAPLLGTHVPAQSVGKAVEIECLLVKVTTIAVPFLPNLLFITPRAIAKEAQVTPLHPSKLLASSIRQFPLALDMGVPQTNRLPAILTNSTNFPLPTFVPAKLRPVYRSKDKLILEVAPAVLLTQRRPPNPILTPLNRTGFRQLRCSLGPTPPLP